jgi:hypothetical protein
MIEENKILLFDIETTPHLTYNWGKYEQNAIAVKEFGGMLCFAYKWLGDKKIHTVGSPKMSTREIAHELWMLFNEADVVVGHNCDSFDVKMANQYFVKYGFKPPSEYKSIDTKKLAKNKFRFFSNKLDDLGEYLELGRKKQTGGSDLWFDCMKGDKKAWRTMLEYNIQDVVLLEKVYLKLRAWGRHPNLNLKQCVNKCPVCQSNKIQSRGVGVNLSGKYQRYQCQDCGRWSRGDKIKENVIIK